MEQHIEKLLRFIDEKAISIELDRLSCVDDDVKFKWDKTKIDQELRKLRSADVVPQIVRTAQKEPLWYRI